jgi:hypothetical protein
MRPLLLVGPSLILMSCAAAMAQEPGAPVLPPGANPQDYFLTLGPYGALVWGAFILGRGVNLTLNVKLADDDRKLVERGVVALEGKP